MPKITYRDYWKILGLDHIRPRAMDDIYKFGGRQGLIPLSFHEALLPPLYIGSMKAQSDTVSQLRRLR